uniref:Uncharacterized protein n=1 Tax=Arundo donax TaxID=35708 RepID=A0A0A9AB44_ARUDO
MVIGQWLWRTACGKNPRSSPPQLFTFTLYDMFGLETY